MLHLTVLFTCLISPILSQPDVVDPIGGTGDRGILSFRIEDEDGERVPARLTFRNIDGSTPALFKNRQADPDDLAVRADVICTLSGAANITVPVGKWNVFASRGPEWSIDQHTITIEKDQTVSTTFSLEHQVDTKGWAAADYHLHTLTHSGHGDSNMPERIISIASEALEVGIATDHNVHTDYSEIIAKLNAAEEFQGIVGNEISVPLGHFNAFPLEPWANVFDRNSNDGPALFRAIRAHRDGSDIEPVVQVNHPRWEGIDYFRVAGLDPITGKSIENNWSVDFDSVEIFNENAGWGYYDADNTDQPIGSSHHWVLQDWHNLLNHGAKITAVGNSDSHTVSANLAGWPRNYFPSSSDLPAQIQVQEVCDTVKDGQIVTSFGPFVTFTVDDATMGQLVTAKRAAVRLEIKVQAADWIDVDRVLVIVDGDIVETIPVPETREVVRLIDSRKIPVRTDGWISLRVEGDDDLDPIVPGKKRPILPIAITNPVYVDADGDGKYTAPVEVARLWLENHDGSEQTLHAEWQARQPNQRAAMLLASQIDSETSRTLARWGITDSSRLVRLTACRLIGTIACGDIEKIQQPLISMVMSPDADPWQRVVALQALPRDVAGDLMAQLLRTSGKKAFGTHAVKLGSLLPGQWVMRWKASNPFPVFGESGLRKVLEMSDQERASTQVLLSGDSGLVDLKKYATDKGRGDKCVVAMQCILVSPTERQVTIAVGSDDGCILQVGDQILIEDFAQQGVDPMRHLVTASLKQGANSVLLLVENGGGSYGASLRVLDDAVTVQQQDPEQSSKPRPSSRERISADMAGIRAAADLFFLDEGRWPARLEELTDRFPGNLPLDPWGRAYQLHSSQTRIEVVSLGADGSRGGNGINADIIAEN